jgi:hypothetical protein
MNKKFAGIVLAASIGAACVFAEAKTNLCFIGTLDAADWTFNSDGSTTSKYLQQTQDVSDSLLCASVSTAYAGVHGGMRLDALNRKIGYDHLYGWLKFGGLKITAGNFDSRFTDRVKKDKTDISFIEAAKYGVAIAGDAASDADNLTGLTASLLSSVCGYTFSFDTSKLIFKGALTTPSASGSAVFSDNIFSGYAFEAVYQNPMFSLDALLKVPGANKLSAGAYATILPVKACSVVVGGAFGSNTATTNTTITSFGVDARVRYAFTDAFSCTFMGNYSSQKKSASGASSDTTVDGKYATLNSTYKITDTVSGFCEAGYIDAGSSESVKGLLGAVVSPGAGAKLQAGVKVEKVIADNGVFKLSVPIALDVSL